MNKKIVSYIGFSIKKGAVKLGIEEIQKAKNKLKLIVFSSTLAQNSYNKIEEYSKQIGVQMVNLTDELNEIFKEKLVKLVGITDKALASAIIKELSQN